MIVEQSEDLLMFTVPRDLAANPAALAAIIAHQADRLTDEVITTYCDEFAIVTATLGDPVNEH